MEDMTREKAADLLYNLIGMFEDNQDNDYDAALRMGIEALTDVYEVARAIATIIENEQDMRVVLAQPQRIRGRWEDAHRYGWNGTFWFIKCSNCGYERKDDTHVLDEEYRFCPYCGAEMRGEQDDNS